MTAFKINLIYVQDCEKRKPKQIYTDQCEIRSEKMIFVNLNRQVIYRAAVEHWAKAAF